MALVLTFFSTKNKRKITTHNNHTRTRFSLYLFPAILFNISWQFSFDVFVLIFVLIRVYIWMCEYIHTVKDKNSNLNIPIYKIPMRLMFLSLFNWLSFLEHFIKKNSEVSILMKSKFFLNYLPDWWKIKVKHLKHIFCGYSLLNNIHAFTHSVLFSNQPLFSPHLIGSWDEKSSKITLRYFYLYSYFFLRKVTKENQTQTLHGSRDTTHNHLINICEMLSNEMKQTYISIPSLFLFVLFFFLLL